MSEVPMGSVNNVVMRLIARVEVLESVLRFVLENDQDAKYLVKDFLDERIPHIRERINSEDWIKWSGEISGLNETQEALIAEVRKIKSEAVLEEVIRFSDLLG